MMKYIVIEADTNDADYIEKSDFITDQDLNLIRPLLDALKKRESKRHNWVTSEYCDDQNPYEMYHKFTEKQIDMMNQYVPYGEYGIHTITSIKIYEVTNEEVIL